MTARRILLYTHALAGGGAERTLVLLASGLAETGDDVIFATDYPASANAGFLDPRVRRVDLGRGHLASIAALSALLQSERPDVSISALGVNNLKHAIAAVLAGRARRAVLGYHGFIAAEPRPLARLSFYLAALLSRMTGRTVAVSRALHANLTGQWHASGARTVTIQNPVDWPRQGRPPTAADLAARAPVVLAAGRLTGEKGFDALVRAFAALNRPEARLVILGEGEARGELEALIATLNLTGQVSLPGYATEPWDCYRQARCFAVSSRSESFGMVIVEALAFGLPVVATDCGGPAEILDRDGLGELVPVGDVAAFSAALGRALDHPGDPGIRLARAEDFSRAAGLAAYQRLIEDVMAEADFGKR